MDGTLVDTSEGIIKSAEFALSKYLLHVSEDKLKKFIGPPLFNTFMDEFGLLEKDAVTAVKLFREKYLEEGIYENCLYIGINELLDKLKKACFNLYITTSKPTLFAEKIVNQHNIGGYFEEIVGSNLDNTRNTKTEVLEYLLMNTSIDKTECIIIGDKKHDIIGANNVGIASIGVTYGYGSYEELYMEKPTIICNNVLEIYNYLMDRII